MKKARYFPLVCGRFRRVAWGKYLHRYMTRAAEGYRFLGMAVMSFAEWQHRWWFVAPGAALVRQSFYSARLFPGFCAIFDVQRDTNRADNHDCGPVMIYTLRLHIRLGLKP
jgi:hypothetical protein